MLCSFYQPGAATPGISVPAAVANFIPTAPGKSRVIIGTLVPKAAADASPAALAAAAAAAKKRPSSLSGMLQLLRMKGPAAAWSQLVFNVLHSHPGLEHAFDRNAIVDGDTYLMHTAERRMLDALAQPSVRFTSPSVTSVRTTQGEQLSDTSANGVPGRSPDVKSYTATPIAAGAPAAVAGNGIGRQDGEQADEDRFAGYRRWLQQNYLPGSSDTLVCAFRSFLYR